MNIGDSERKKMFERKCISLNLIFKNINILFQINVKIDSIKEELKNKRIYRLPVFFDVFFLTLYISYDV